MSFELHPRLVNGSIRLGHIGISQLLLKTNAAFPWFLLVPEVESGNEDLHQLSNEQYQDVCSAIRRVSQFVAATFPHEKLNVAAIGNQVRQLHIHIVARTTEDPAWPGVVWSCDAKLPYREEEIETIRQKANVWFSF